MSMSQDPEAMEEAIIIIASVMGFVCFGLLMWVIILQIGVSSLKKRMLENETKQHELSKRGYQEYKGTPAPPPLLQNVHPELQRQASVQPSMFNPNHDYTRNPSMARGPSPPMSQSSGYDRRPPSNNNYGNHGGIRVLPGGGGYQQQPPPPQSDSRMKQAKVAGGYAYDALDTLGVVGEAQDRAKEEAQAAMGKWF